MPDLPKKNQFEQRFAYICTLILELNLPSLPVKLFSFVI